MKLANMIMILLILQMSIIIFDAVSVSDYELTAYDSNDTVVWDFILDPTGWTETSLFVLFAGLVGLVGAIGVGVYLVTKSDTVLFFGVFTLLLGVGAIPIVSLYQMFGRNVGFFGCDALPCLPVTIVWALTGGLLAIFYVLSVLEWWSNRSVGS